jgi:hypothetical protein
MFTRDLYIFEILIGIYHHSSYLLFMVYTTTLLVGRGFIALNE